MLLRSIACMLLVVAAGWSSGCTMCQSPYDYCGPTFVGGCGDCCNPDERLGSILGGHYYTPRYVPPPIYDRDPAPRGGAANGRPRSDDSEFYYDDELLLETPDPLRETYRRGPYR